MSPRWSPGLRGLLCSLAVLPGLSMCKCGDTESASHHLWGLSAAAWPVPFHNPPPCWVQQSSPCCDSSLPRLPVCAPSPGLDECFFFNSLVVRLPYSSIFCQFWLFFVFKLSFWLCEEAQCVYLCLHLGWKPISLANLSH